MNEERRNAYITDRIHEDCVGCEDVPSYDRETGEPLIGFRPAERCPVHGRQHETWWAELNRELEHVAA